MKRFVFLVLMIIFCLVVFAGEANEVFVRAPVLKLSIMSALDEIYLANVLVPDKWKAFYDDGSDERYQWLVSTYNRFSQDQKRVLNKVFEKTSTWNLMNVMQDLPDDATMEDINRKISFSFSIPLFIKGDLNGLLKDFYKDHFKDYYEGHLPYYVSLAERLTQESDDLPNPFEYIEMWTGITLGDYECVFYYTFRKVGAWGFTSGNRKVSTIQAGVDSLDLLYSAPLHEYSHNFFQTFTKDKDFKRLSERLVAIESLYNGWNDSANLKRSYDWRAFCEENLVEGFAKYLRWKLNSENDPKSGIYPLDFEFFEFLKEKDFSPQEYSLKEISFLFYEGLLE